MTTVGDMAAYFRLVISQLLCCIAKHKVVVLVMPSVCIFMCLCAWTLSRSILFGLRLIGF